MSCVSHCVCVHTPVWRGELAALAEYVYGMLPLSYVIYLLMLTVPSLLCYRISVFPASVSLGLYTIVDQGRRTMRIAHVSTRLRYRNIRI
jgi:hypothetical protein